MPGRCKGLATLIIVLAFAAPSHALAGPYEDGDAAFRRKDYAVAMERWRPLAEGDDARAQAGMAAIYHGGLGVARDYAQALYWCEKAAAHGDARAQYLLGAMYRDGSGAQRDLVRAMALFRQAAEQDLHWAQYNLGLMYLKGEGVSADYAEAYHWLALASVVRDRDDAQVHSTATFLLDKASARLTPEQIKEARQRVNQWKPSPSR
jgi:TPR repeat protein